VAVCSKESGQHLQVRHPPGEHEAIAAAPDRILDIRDDLGVPPFVRE
jgi:hypothetical protein